MSEIRTLLINPTVDLQRTVGFLRKVFTPVAPLGIAYLAAVLKQAGFAVEVHDQFESGLSAEALADKVVREEWDLVGFSILTPNMPAVEQMVAAIRDRVPATRILFGNIHAAVYKQELVDKGACDFVIYGEGEYALLELVRALHNNVEDMSGIKGLVWKRGKETIINPPREQIRELDALPFPDWSDLNLPRYLAPATILKTRVIMPVILSRGCPWHCTFCAQNINYPKVRKRTVENLLDEVERNIDEYGIEWFGFQDAIFPLHDKDAFRFADAMVRRGLHQRCKWLTEARVDTVSYEGLKALKEAGLFLMMYGFESGNDDILKLHSKGHTTDDSRRAMAWTRDLGIFTYGLFMIGLPGESEKTMEDTIRFAIELDPEVAKFNRFTPYPGSQLFFGLKDELDEGKFSPESMTPWSTGQSADEYVFTPEGISRNRMRQIQRNAVLKYYLRPRQMVRMARINLAQPRNLAISVGAVANLLLESAKAGLRSARRTESEAS